MGFLNTHADDEAMIQSSAENGTTEAPPLGTFDETGKAIAQGAAGGINAVGRAIEDLPLGQSYADSLQPPVLKPLSAPVTPQSNPLDDMHETRTALDKWIEDTRGEGSGAKTLGNVTKGLTEYGLGTAAGGPVVGALAVGGGTGDESYRQLREQGFDEKTATEAATFQGILAGGGALVPGGFGKLWSKVLGTAAINEGLGLAARAGQAGILEANGYDKAAHAQRIFDGQQMLVDATLGAGFGLFGAAHEAITPRSKVDAALAEADNLRSQNAAPGVPKDADTANLHNDVLSQTLDDLQSGRPVDIPREQAEALADGIVPDPKQMEQVAESAKLYGEDPLVQNAVEMGPKLDEAYARLGQEPTQNGYEPVDHAGNPSTFRTPDELARDEHAAKVAQLVAKHNIPVEAAQDMHGLLTLPPRDALTGFYNKDTHDQLVRNAIAHARETGETVHYVEADSLNMGGRNAAIGHTRTNDMLRAEAQAFAQELGRAGHVVPVRHGGDELSAVVIGARSDADIQAALDRANARVQAAAEQAGLGHLKNPKGGEGLGLATAFKRLTGNERPRDVTEPIDAQIEAQKQEIHSGQRTGAAPGTGRADAGAAGQAPGGAAGEAQGQRGGVRTAEAPATEEAPRTAPLTPDNEARLQQIEAKYGHEMVELPDGERVTVAQLAQRMREEAALADSDNKALEAAVACFLRTGGNA